MKTIVMDGLKGGSIVGFASNEIDGALFLSVSESGDANDTQAVYLNAQSAHTLGLALLNAAEYLNNLEVYAK